MYTIESIQVIRNKAKLLHLSAPCQFWQSKASKLATICNGVGSENCPEPIRDIMSFLYRNYPVSVAIHDVRYEYSDGFSENRHVADLEFGDNLIKEWVFRYGALRWINPFALIGFLKIRMAFYAVSKFGASAWLEACKNHYKNQ